MFPGIMMLKTLQVTPRITVVTMIATVPKSRISTKMSSMAW